MAKLVNIVRVGTQVTILSI